MQMISVMIMIMQCMYMVQGHMHIISIGAMEGESISVPDYWNPKGILYSGGFLESHILIGNIAAITTTHQTTIRPKRIYYR